MYQVDKGLTVLAVADGTSAAQGGEYSRHLMEQTKLHAAAESGDAPAEVPLPRWLLEEGWKSAGRAQIEGRSTAMVLTLDGALGQLSASYVGDCGFAVLRPKAAAAAHGWTYAPVCQSEPQQHYFNCPYQLGLFKTVEDETPEHAQDMSFKLRMGDVVVLATDGLWDALFTEEIIAIVSRNMMDGVAPSDIARELVETAHRLALQKHRDSPFAMNARDEGLIAAPIEVQDDQTVLIAVCLPQRE